MMGFMSAKTKRKGFDDVYDDFSEISLNYPSRKIRRLDAELPPIMEEEDAVVSVDQLMAPELASGVVSAMVEVEPSLPQNEERALVLYQQADNRIVMPQLSDVSFTIHEDVVRGLKHRAFWPANPNAKPVEKSSMDYKPAVDSNSLAIVPWVASQVPLASSTDSRIVHEEPMEADDEAEGASMEVEDDKKRAGNGFAGESLHQWQPPQHCLIPQPPQNTATPVTWSWGWRNTQ